MPSPCSRCSSRSLSCLIDLSSGRCSECIRSGRKCDLVVSETDWANLRKLKKSVQEQLDEVELRASQLHLELAAIAAQMSTLSSRRLRLRKEAGLLSEKEKEMFARELASIEEVERLEAAAAESSKASVSDPSLPAEFLVDGLPTDFDFSCLLSFGEHNAVSDTSQAAVESP